MPHMSKTFSNVLAVPIFWIALLSIVHKTGALTLSSWISVACIARQSNWQPHNSMLLNVVMQLSFECDYLAVEMTLLAAIVFGAIYVENLLGKLHTFAISFLFFCNLF